MKWTEETGRTAKCDACKLQPRELGHLQRSHGHVQVESIVLVVKLLSIQNIPLCTVPEHKVRLVLSDVLLRKNCGRSSSLPRETDQFTRSPTPYFDPSELLLPFTHSIRISVKAAARRIDADPASQQSQHRCRVVQGFLHRVFSTLPEHRTRRSSTCLWSEKVTWQSVGDAREIAQFVPRTGACMGSAQSGNTWR